MKCTLTVAYLAREGVADGYSLLGAPDLNDDCETYFIWWSKLKKKKKKKKKKKIMFHKGFLNFSPFKNDLS